MRTPAQQREYDRGTLAAESLHMTDVSLLMDQFVLDEFDWRDWFDEKPSAQFLSAFSRTVELREQAGA